MLRSKISKIAKCQETLHKEKNDNFLIIRSSIDELNLFETRKIFCCLSVATGHKSKCEENQVSG